MGGMLMYYNGANHPDKYDDARSVGESGWAFTVGCSDKYAQRWGLRRIRDNVYTITMIGSPKNTYAEQRRKGWQMGALKTAKDKRKAGGYWAATFIDKDDEDDPEWELETVGDTGVYNVKLANGPNKGMYLASDGSDKRDKVSNRVHVTSSSKSTGWKFVWTGIKGFGQKTPRDELRVNTCGHLNAQVEYWSKCFYAKKSDKKTSSATTGYHDKWNLGGGKQEAVSGLWSKHKKLKMDRRWKLQFSELSDSTVKISTRKEWKSAYNPWDGAQKQHCPANKVVTSIESHFDNKEVLKAVAKAEEELKSLDEKKQKGLEKLKKKYEEDVRALTDAHAKKQSEAEAKILKLEAKLDDRQYRITCRDVEGISREEGRNWTTYLNVMNGLLTYNPDKEDFIVGMGSYHSDAKDDRRFKFLTTKLCKDMTPQIKEAKKVMSAYCEKR